MANRVAAIPELKLLLLEQIGQDRAAVANLCRVNKTFHIAFTPALYTSIHFDSSDEPSIRSIGKSATFSDGDGGESWSLTRKLAINELHDLLSYQPGFVPHQINVGLASILRQTHNLVSFDIRHSDISHESLDQLTRISTLRRVAMAFAGGSQERIGIGCVLGDELPERWARHGALFGTPQAHIGALRNLTSLALLKLFGDLPPWQEPIANALAQSPQLESLALSIDEACYERTISFDRGYDWLADFTDGICTMYSAKTTHRLHLTKLSLGEFIFCPSLACLEKVTDLTCLEQMHIYNDTGKGPEFHTKFDILAASTTPALRKLAFTHLNEDIWENFSSFSDGSRDLQLTFDDFAAYEDDQNMYHLFEAHPEAIVQELRFPALYDSEQAEDRRLDLLHGKSFLRLISLPVLIDELLDEDGSLLKACSALVATLPELQTLWLMPDERWATGHSAHEYAPAALQIAQSSAKLSFIKIGFFSWLVERDRGAQASVVQVSKLEYNDVAPEPLKSWFPTAFDAVHASWGNDTPDLR